MEGWSVPKWGWAWEQAVVSERPRPKAAWQKEHSCSQEPRGMEQVQVYEPEAPVPELQKAKVQAQERLSVPESETARQGQQGFPRAGQAKQG